MWSFGILLFEITTLGGEPYPGFDETFDLANQIMGGYRMLRPAGCSEKLYEEVMLQCWVKDPAARPSFSFILKKLNALKLERSQGDAAFEGVYAVPQTILTTVAARNVASVGVGVGVGASAVAASRRAGAGAGGANQQRSHGVVGVSQSGYEYARDANITAAPATAAGRGSTVDDENHYDLRPPDNGEGQHKRARAAGKVYSIGLLFYLKNRGKERRRIGVAFIHPCWGFS